MLQFVPSHIDVRFCNFSESIEKGLTMAFAEVRRRSKESTNFTVHVSGSSGQFYEAIFYTQDITVIWRWLSTWKVNPNVPNVPKSALMLEC